MVISKERRGEQLCLFLFMPERRKEMESIFKGQAYDFLTRKYEIGGLQKTSYSPHKGIKRGPH